MMKKNKVTRFGFLMFIFTLLSIFTFVKYIKSPNSPYYDCHGNIRYTSLNNSDKVTSNLMITQIPGANYINLSGEIHNGENPYVVRRDLYLTNKTNKGTTAVTKTVILPGDTVDEKLWVSFFMPRPMNVPFYVTTRHLTGNLYYVSFPSVPLFICAHT